MAGGGVLAEEEGFRSSFRRAQRNFFLNDKILSQEPSPGADRAGDRGFGGAEQTCENPTRMCTEHLLEAEVLTIAGKAGSC